MVLSTQEEEEFSRLETVIANNWRSTLDFGRALMAIQTKKLYRATHDTFEAYCRERWGIGRAQGYRAIGVAQVVQDLSPFGDTLPANEAQCRPLLPLSREDRLKAWHAVAQKVTDKPITARLIKEVIAALHPIPAAPGKPKKDSNPKHDLGFALAAVNEIEQAVREGQTTEQVLQLLVALRERLEGAAQKTTKGVEPVEPQHNSPTQTL